MTPATVSPPSSSLSPTESPPVVSAARPAELERGTASALALGAAAVVAGCAGEVDPYGSGTLEAKQQALTSVNPADPACGCNGSSTAVLGTFDTKSAARLLGQATFGATRSEIDRLQVKGAAAWVDEQLAMPRGGSHVAWLYEQGYAIDELRSQHFPANHSLWRAFLTRPDQLRQRMVYALSQIFVVSLPGLTTIWPAFAAGYFLDVLDEHALGSFRALLEAVTLSPAMGVYLSMRGSQRASGTGRQPDENYAREVMQLFTIGVHELDPDGRVRQSGGAPIESYDSADVSGLARVFTGWDYASGGSLTDSTPARVTRPMQHYAARHETGEKRFLGTIIPAGTSGPDSLAMALDALVAHPNVGPFIGRQLIQRFVTANPSPGYVARVAAVFANDGRGVRGNLAQVLRQVLLDPEAQRVAVSPIGGKLTEPVLRFTQWARAAELTSPSGQWRLGSLADPRNRLGQSPLQSGSVFNFFRPGYVPPGTRLASAGLVSPEMQITTETSVAGYLNFMHGVLAATGGIVGSDLVPNWLPWLKLADAPQVLVDELNLVLAAERLGPATRTLLVEAITAMPAASETDRLNRVRAAMLLVLASPEYLVST